MAEPIVRMLERVMQPNGAFRQSPYVGALNLPAMNDSESPRAAAPDIRDIARTQYVLLDLIRADRLHDELRLLIVGDDSASDAVATLDLFLLWWHVCHLHGAEFPLSNVQFTLGYRTEEQRRTSREILGRFADILNERSASRDSADPARTVVGWAEQVHWAQFEPDRFPFQPDDLFDLALFADQEFGAIVPEVANQLAPAGSMVLIGPGTRDDSVALSRFRRAFLREHQLLSAIGPCGQEFGDELPECCDSCWPVRSEYLDMPVAEVSNGSDNQPHAESVTTWSYTILGKTGSHSTQPVRVNGASGVVSGSFPQTRNLRFIGAFRGNDPVPVQQRHDQATTSSDKFYVKVCPADTAGMPALVSCSSDMLGHDLCFGDRFDLNIQYQESRGRGLVLYPQSAEIKSQQSLNGDFTGFLPDPEASTVDRVNRALDEIAFRLFRFPELREFQHVILTRVLAGKSTLGIAATGGGKSECFILPAMLMSGVTIVVSPLKSLMMDQYQERICRRYNFGDRVTWINGDLTSTEQRRRLKLAESGAFSLIYLTPEQLEKESTLRALHRIDSRAGIRYLAVDEAHCVSQWGHDFRQSYLNTLRRMAEVGLNPVRIALTATASPAVRVDICQELDLDNRPVAEGGDVYIYSSNRPELNLITRVVHTRAGKVQSILQELQQFRNGSDSGSAIVFMPWTEPKSLKKPTNATEVTPHVASMASYLEHQLQSRVAIYHSKMDETDGSSRKGARRAGGSESSPFGDVADRERASEQNAFIRGDRRIMVATKGFGMGIDKPDIRTVIHATPPGNLEAYVQEAGRAGRDGEPANVVLYYSPDGATDNGDFFSDFRIQQNFLEGKLLRSIDIKGLARYLFARQRREGSQLQLTVEDTRDFVNNYVRQRNGTEKTFPARRQQEIESDEHATLLDRGYLYGEWARYLHRLISELNAFAGLLQNAGGAVFFESATRVNRHRDSAVSSLSLDQRRERFGARYRAWPGEANRRAHRAGRGTPNLDDWFGEKELPWPVGWYVTLGSAFNDVETLTAFVDAFCDAHDQRYKNASDSYTRLLTDYLGLHPDGTRNPEAESECLRSVMLGYLKTNEIVHDGNCRSCSNCVPDERFDRYTLEERRNSVVRLDDEIREALEYLESRVEKLPEDGPLEILLEAIQRNTQSAHSLRRYLAGWTGRILDEQPEHVAVRWLRLRMLDEVGSPQLYHEEFSGHVRNLAQHLDDTDLPHLWSMLENIDIGIDDDATSDLIRHKARVAQRLGYHRAEANALQQIIDSAGELVTWFADEARWIVERVRDLHAPSAALPDQGPFRWAMFQLARMSTDETEAMRQYAELVEHWRWDAVLDEFRILELPQTPRVAAMCGLLRVWIDQNQAEPEERSATLTDYLSRATPEFIDGAERDTIRLFLDVIRDEDLYRTPAVADRLAIRLLNETSDGGVISDDVAGLLSDMLAQPDFSTPVVTRRLAELIVQGMNPDEIEKLLPVRPAEESVSRSRLHLAGVIARELPNLDEESLAHWLRCFSVDLHLESPQLCQAVIAALASPVSSPEVRFDTSRLAACALFAGDAPDSLHQHWISLSRDTPGLLGEYIQDSLESEPTRIEWAELAFDQMLASGNLRDIAPFLQWAYRSETVRPSSRVTNAAALFDVITQWAAARKATGAGSEHVDHRALEPEFVEWCEQHQFQGVRNMDENDYRRILDLSLRRIVGSG